MKKAILSLVLVLTLLVSLVPMAALADEGEEPADEPADELGDQPSDKPAEGQKPPHTGDDSPIGLWAGALLAATAGAALTLKKKHN